MTLSNDPYPEQKIVFREIADVMKKLDQKESDGCDVMYHMYPDLISDVLPIGGLDTCTSNLTSEKFLTLNITELEMKPNHTSLTAVREWYAHVCPSSGELKSFPVLESDFISGKRYETTTGALLLNNSPENPDSDFHEVDRQSAEYERGVEVVRNYIKQLELSLSDAPDPNIKLRLHDRAGWWLVGR